MWLTVKCLYIYIVLTLITNGKSVSKRNESGTSIENLAN